MNKWERLLHHLALIFVVLSLVGELFFPATFRFIFDDLFFPFGVLFLAVTFFKNPKWRWLIIAFSAIVAWGFLSDVLSHGIRTGHIGMLLRWVKWPIMLIVMAELSNLNLRPKLVENGVIVVFLTLVGINLLMMLNPFGLGRDVSELFASRQDVLLANYHEFGAFRLSGTMMNPNNNAILFGLFLLFFLHLNPRKFWKYILMAFILIFLTQSRTVLIVTLAILAIYVLRANTRKVNLILIPSAIISLIVGLFLFRSTNLLSIFDGTAFQSDSWLERVDHYGVLLKSGFSELIIGHGIVLDPFGTLGFYFDTEYLSISYQYGLIGILIWASAIGIIAKIALKTNRKSTFGWAIVLFTLGIAPTNYIFLNVECATLMMILIGAWLFLQRDNELGDHSQKEAE